MTPLSAGGLVATRFLILVNVTECSGRVKTGEGTAERESGGKWEVEMGGKNALMHMN